MRHPLTTARYSHEYLDKRLQNCIQRYLLATQPPFEDTPDTFTAWAEALAWDAYTPEQQAALRTVAWATDVPPTMDTLTTVTVYAGVASYDHAISLPVCVPVNRDQLVLPLCSNPTEPVRHAYSTSVYVTTTPLETTLAQGLNRYSLAQGLNRYVSRAGASSPVDALRPRCLDTYPWESRFQLSARLTDARHLLRDYMRKKPQEEAAMPLRQLLTLCPELRPTAVDLKAHRWTRTAAVREYAHVTDAQRTAWTDAINRYIRTTMEDRPSSTTFRDLDDLRATLIPVMAHAQMTGGHQ
jgi:hypothetical protein